MAQRAKHLKFDERAMEHQFIVYGCLTKRVYVWVYGVAPVSTACFIPMGQRFSDGVKEKRGRLKEQFEHKIKGNNT